jgi:arginyl-tRNA synthetase
VNLCVHPGFTKSEEIELVKSISTYSEALENTAITNSPHVLCKYAYDLTKAFNSLYNNVHILNEEDEDKKIIRLKLITLFSETLKDCFKMLGIEMPDKM